MQTPPEILTDPITTRDIADAIEKLIILQIESADHVPDKTRREQIAKCKERIALGFKQHSAANEAYT